MPGVAGAQVLVPLLPAASDEDALKMLDSSMKRNTALTRKLKQLSEESKQSILDDIAKTNQSKVGLALAARSVGPLRQQSYDKAPTALTKART